MGKYHIKVVGSMLPAGVYLEVINLIPRSVGRKVTLQRKNK